MKQNWIAERKGGHFEDSCAPLKQVGGCWFWAQIIDNIQTFEMSLNIFFSILLTHEGSHKEVYRTGISNPA